jgi:hypothetical protein
MQNEAQENLTLFFRPFLNTPEGMDKKDPQALLLGSCE